MPEALTCLIVDNDPYDRGKLVQCLANFQARPLRLAGTCANGKEAFNFLRETDVDILFLDLEMPVMDGPSLLTVLETKAHKPVVCIVTVGQIEPYEQAWTYKEFTRGLLLKPFNQADFDREMNKIIRIFPGNSLKLTFLQKDNRKDKRVRDLIFDLIVCISCEREDKTFLYASHADQPQMEELLHVQFSMEEIIKMLPPDQFFRVHQSYIVNRRYIREYHPIRNSIAVAGFPKLIAIAQRNKRDFEHWFRRKKIQ